MSFSFNGLSGAAVTISGGITSTIPTAGSTQTFVKATAAGTGGVATIYTVTAGKTLYLFGFNVQPGVAAQGTLLANDGTTVLAAAGNLCDRIQGGGCPIAVFTASQAVKYSGPGTMTFFITGVEV